MDFCKRYCEEGRAVLSPGASDSIHWELESPNVAYLVLALRVGDADDMELLRCLLSLSRATSLPQSTRLFGLIRFFEELVTLCSSGLQDYSQDRLTEYFSDGIRNASQIRAADATDLQLVFTYKLNEAFVALLKQTWNKPSLLRIVNSAKLLEPAVSHKMLTLDSAQIKAMAQWNVQRPQDKMRILQSLKEQSQQDSENDLTGIEHIISQGIAEIKQNLSEYSQLHGFNEFVDAVGTDWQQAQTPELKQSQPQNWGQAQHQRQIRQRSPHPPVEQSVEQATIRYFNELRQTMISGVFVDTSVIFEKVKEITSSDQQSVRVFGQVTIRMLEADAQKVSQLHPKVFMMWRVFGKAVKQFPCLDSGSTARVVQIVKQMVIEDLHSKDEHQGYQPYVARHAHQGSRPPPPAHELPSQASQAPIAYQVPRAQQAPAPLSTTLSNRMVELFTPYLATQQISQQIPQTIRQCKAMLEANDILVKIEAYGSSIIGAWLYVSPLNFNLSPTNIHIGLTEISECLCANGIQTTIISKGDKRMLEFQHPESKLKFQFSMNFEEGQVFGKCLKELFVKEQFTHLLLFLKYWMLHTGALNRNSYMLTLLLIHFSQQQTPPLMPPLNQLAAFGGRGNQVTMQASTPELSVLAEKFFYYFAEQCPNGCADLRTGKPYPSDGANTSTVRDPVNGRPLTWSDNAARTRFRQAYQMMQNREDFEACLRIS